MKTISVKLPPDLNAKLDALSKRLGKSKSILIRLALSELLRNPDMSDKLSAHELLRPYIGAVAGLPSDLSFVANNLKGYGE
jgi:predicted DNA-binding protein